MSKKQQYQHYVPQFILRNFEQSHTLSQTDSAKKSKSKKDGSLKFIRTLDGSIQTSPTKRHYGILDMYEGQELPGQQTVEKEFGKLESKAARVLDQALRACQKPGVAFEVKRKEKDDLVKFLWIMKYRNQRMHTRFDVDTFEEYTSNDRELLRDYMEKNGISSPREVWLRSLRAFLNVEFDLAGKWQESILTQAFHLDALWFITRIRLYYTAFCTPHAADAESFLTDNVYGIFEGPVCSLTDQPLRRDGEAMYTEHHTFAPISPRLMIVLRAHYLPGGAVDLGTDPFPMYDLLRVQYPVPESAGSILQDLPVTQCESSYADMKDGKLIAKPGVKGLSDKDRFKYKVFRLDQKHNSLINAILLEQALDASSIVYSSERSMADALSYYLLMETPGFKIVESDACLTRHYIRSLHHALRTLRPYTSLWRPVKWCLPSCTLAYIDHLTDWTAYHVSMAIRTSTALESIYDLLLPPPEATGQTESMRVTQSLATTPRHKLWLEDMTQAGKLAFLHDKTDCALARCSTIVKRFRKKIRLKFFATLNPRHIWLYVKVMRNLDKSGPLLAMGQLSSPLKLEGAEDTIVKDGYRNLHGLSNAMLIALQGQSRA